MLPGRAPWPHHVDQSLLLSIGTATAAIMWAYDGWGNVTVLAEELRQPERNVPRALVGGVLLVTLLYFGANLAYHLTLSVAEITDTRIPAVAFARRVWPDWGEAVVQSMLMVSLAGALNGNILVGPRVVFAVACDHPLLVVFQPPHRAPAVPVRATIGVCCWAAVLVLLGDLGARTGSGCSTV